MIYPHHSVLYTSGDLTVVTPGRHGSIDFKAGKAEPFVMQTVINEILSKAWMCWALAAVLAALLEVLVPYFTFSFASLGAVIATLLSLKYGWEVQVGGFALTTVVSLLFVRPVALRHMRVPHQIPSRTQKLVGLTGEVTEMIDPVRNSGRILVGGEDWAAQSNQIIEVGRPAQVLGADGITLIVKEVEV